MSAASGEGPPNRPQLGPGTEVPQGRLSRLVRMAASGARAGASLLGGTDSAARSVASNLGELRGLAAKLGQIAGYVDGVVPEGSRQPYERSLTGLFAGAARSEPGAVRRLVETELGQPLDRLFAEWDDEPIASASIGQVHRARLPDGIAVAVKVQHPGIDAAVLADLQGADVLEKFAAMAGSRRFESDGIIAEARARFTEELDYEHEAAQQEWFAAFHAQDPTVRIPAIHRSHTRRRVLTMDFVEGATFAAACAADEPQRRRWAETLWRFVFRGNLLGGRFNADPHPGNYLFHPDGAITFLDFGCVQRIPEKRLNPIRAMHRAAIARDEAAFTAACVAMFEARPGRYQDLTVGFTRSCFDPVFGSPYRIDRAYTTQLWGASQQVALKGRFLPRAEIFPMPPDLLFTNRLHFGFYSVLARLDVQVDYAQVEADFLARAESLGA